MENKKRNYGTPECPNCGEECHVCTHETCYELNGEWFTEEDLENEDEED